MITMRSHGTGCLKMLLVESLFHKVGHLDRLNLCCGKIDLFADQTWSDSGRWGEMRRSNAETDWQRCEFDDSGR